MITAYVVGADALIARLEAVPDKLHAALVTAIARSALQVQRRAMEKLGGPVLKVRTGNLRSSINVQGPSDSASGIYASVGTKVVYAGVHEFGGQTAPHVITPRNARVLAFPLGGKTVFARRVNHPGSRMPERSFLRSSLRELAPTIRAELERAIGQTVTA